MALRGSADRFGTLAIALHWISAIVIVASLILGLAAANSAVPAGAASLLRVHVPLGLLVLALTLLRLAWRFRDTRPAAPDGQPPWQKAAADIVHMLLYQIILVLGLSGLGTMLASGLGPILFGGAHRSLPDFTTIMPFFVHRVAAFALLGLLAAHLSAVVYHQCFRRDRLLARMGLGKRAGRSGRP